MSIMDYENEMSDAQALTTTALSDFIIDLNSYPQYIAGEDLFVNVKINTALATGTSVRAVLWTDNTATVTDGADIITGDIVLTAAALAGVSLLRVNLQGLPLQQFIGIQYVIVGTYDAGSVDAYLEVTPEVVEVTLA